MKTLFLISICLISWSCKHKKSHKLEQTDPTSGSVFTLTKKLNDQFLYYFHILDSASSRNNGDTILGYDNATQFMEEFTRIESEGDKGYVGNESFTKNDLRKWHNWYDSTSGKIQ